MAGFGRFLVVVAALVAMLSLVSSTKTTVRRTATSGGGAVDNNNDSDEPKVVRRLEGYEKAPEGRKLQGYSNLVSVVIEELRFQLLRDLIILAALREPVEDPEPLTLFAPDNAAWKKFDTRFDYGEEMWIAHLQNIVLFHLTPGIITSEDIIMMNGENIPMLNGEYLLISIIADPVTHVKSVKLSSPYGAEAFVEVVDFVAPNGIAHQINCVLKPHFIFTNIVEVLHNDPKFSTLVAAIVEADLVEALAAGGPFTLFAPTNDAFDALPDGALDELLADKTLLQEVLLYHVLGGVLPKQFMVSEPFVPTLLDGFTIDLRVSVVGVVSVNSIKVTWTDILANNGIIHAIDGVLVP